jgi:mannose-6-phosphate isomerase-like protein (cupin superfamily)
MPPLDRVHLRLADALRQLPGPTAARSVELFRHGTLLVKLYAPSGHDPQTPHSRDEIYVVAHGNGIFYDGNARRPFAVGDLLFAPAGSEHRFEDFTEDFAVWVMCYGPEGGEPAT